MAVIKKTPPSFLSEEFFAEGSQYQSYKDIYRKAVDWGINTNPLDIETFIRKHGIRIVREDMEDDLSGYIELRNNYWVIGIDKYQNLRRQRFTLAHEFAHFLFDKTDIETAGRLSDQIMLRSEETDPKERRASEFAAELLIPKHLFKQQVDSGVRDIAELAERFDVSMAAIRYRAYKLNYIKRY